MYFVNKKLFILLLFISLIGCKNEQYTNVVQQLEPIEEVEEEIIIDENCKIGFKHQFKTGFVELKQIDSLNYKLIWGNDSFQREISDSFYCHQISEDKQCDFTPKLIKETSEYILLKSVWATSSANNCSPLIYQLWYLPINKNKAVFSKIGFIELIDDYLIFNKDGESLMIKNINTKKEQIIQLKPKPYIEFKELENSIDTISINQNSLNVKYLTGTHEDYGFITKAFKLK